MAEVSSGLRSILSLSSIYRLFDWMVGAESSRKTIAAEYLRLDGGERVLDIGCGTAPIYAHLPAVTYVGFDSSSDYIAAAKDRFGDDIRVAVDTVRAISFEPRERFDLVMAIGVVHHLDDDEAEQVFQLASGLLDPGGRLVTVDPTFSPGQGGISRFLVSRDRGQNVRPVAGYLELAESVFPQTEHFVRTDLLRIPYTHMIMECTKT